MSSAWDFQTLFVDILSLESRYHLMPSVENRYSRREHAHLLNGKASLTYFLAPPTLSQGTT